MGFQKDQEKYQMENIDIFVTIILLNLSKLKQFGGIWGSESLLRRYNLAAKKKLFELKSFFFESLAWLMIIMWCEGQAGWVDTELI